MDATRHEITSKADVWRGYRRAFADFSQKARQIQSLTTCANSDQGAIDAALLELEKARQEYSRRRDALARDLLQSGAADLRTVSAERVRALANLLWEAAGRPEGTAEDDWHRAEELVRGSAAA